MNAPATRTEHVTFRYDSAGLAAKTLGLLDEIQALTKSPPLADEEDAVFCADRLRFFKNLQREVEAAYKVARGPIRELELTIAGLFKPYRDLLALGVERYDAVSKAFALRQAAERRHALAAAGDAANQGDTRALTTALAVAQDAQPRKLEGVAHRLTWAVESVDPTHLPREWTIPNMRALDDYARNNGTPDAPPPVIPGVTWRQVAQSRVSR